jgi:hypothetical protein
MHTSRNKYTTKQVKILSVYSCVTPLTDALRALPDKFDLHSTMLSFTRMHLLMSYLISAGDDVIPNQYGETYNPNALNHRICIYISRGNNRTTYNRLTPEKTCIKYAKTNNRKTWLTFLWCPEQSALKRTSSIYGNGGRTRRVSN